jgi:hypothetical protein
MVLSKTVFSCREKKSLAVSFFKFRYRLNFSPELPDRRAGHGCLVGQDVDARYAI